MRVLRRMVLRGDIEIELAEASRWAFRDLRLTRHVMTYEMSDRICQLRENVTAHDAAYAALAEQLSVPLVTTDQRLGAGVRELTAIDVESHG